MKSLWKQYHQNKVGVENKPVVKKVTTIRAHNVLCQTFTVGCQIELAGMNSYHIIQVLTIYNSIMF